MKNILSLWIFILCCNLSHSQVNDTVSLNSFVINFNKVKKSFKEGNKAEMKVEYIPNTKMATLKFKVPSFIFRLKTTKSDYCIIETNTNQILLQNESEKEVIGNDLVGFYDFSFNISKDSLANIITDDVKRITFYFMPNPEIEMYLLQNTHINKSYDKLSIRNSKKTVKYIVSKPDKNQYETFKQWLKLK